MSRAKASEAGVETAATGKLSAMAKISLAYMAYSPGFEMVTSTFVARHRQMNWLPSEFAFLKMNVQNIIEADNVDLMGEFLDTLKAFGLTTDDDPVSEGVSYRTRFPKAMRRLTSSSG